MPTRVINMQTPLERLLGETPDYTYFKVFGCAYWPNLRPYNRYKLEFRSKKCVFLGYSPLHKGYKCLHVPSNHLYISQDVDFDELVFPFSNLPSSASPPSPVDLPVSLDQFEDYTYAPSLLPNHGAGIERGARLELLENSPPVQPLPVDHRELDRSLVAPMQVHGQGAPPVLSTTPGPVVSPVAPVHSRVEPAPPVLSAAPDHVVAPALPVAHSSATPVSRACDMSPLTLPLIASTGSSATPAVSAVPFVDDAPNLFTDSGTYSAVPSPSSAPVLAPVVPLPIDSLRPVTRSLRGIHQRK
jgi:hypothetical protein